MLILDATKTFPQLIDIAVRVLSRREVTGRRAGVSDGDGLLTLVRTYSSKAEVVSTIARSLPEVGGNRDLDARAQTLNGVFGRSKAVRRRKGSPESVASKSNVMRRSS